MPAIPQTPYRGSVDGMEEGTPEDQSGTTIGNRSNSHIAGRRKDSTDNNSAKKKQAWCIRWIKGWGSGMRNDIVHRLPYYWSDWTDAWNYRVVPATWVSQVCCSCLGQAPAVSDMADSHFSLSFSPISFPESHSPWT